MTDFRGEMYRRYVSAFKGDASRSDGTVRTAYLRWCERMYLPLLADLDTDARILELGCGPGYVLEFLASHGFRHAEGVDISEEQVALARARNLNARVANASDALDDLDGQLDAVIAMDFVEHFTVPELMGLLARIHSLLKEDGLFIIQTPNGEGLLSGQVVYGDLTHMTTFTPGSLSQILRQAGFDRMQYFDVRPVPDSLKGLIRTVMWRPICLVANAVRWVESGKKQDLWAESFLCCCRKRAAGTLTPGEHGSVAVGAR